jgi:hypothetical protein
MVYGELRGIGIVERVYCSTTNNFYGSLYRSGSIASRFIMYMDRYDLGSNPVESNNVIKETGVFQTYSIAFSRFSNFHREFSNFPIAFCNVFSKINLINNNNNLRITNAAKTFHIINT